MCVEWFTLSLFYCSVNVPPPLLLIWEGKKRYPLSLCRTTVRAHTHTYTHMSPFRSFTALWTCRLLLIFLFVWTAQRRFGRSSNKKRTIMFSNAPFVFFLFLRYCLCDHPNSVFTPRPPICKKWRSRKWWATTSNKGPEKLDDFLSPPPPPSPSIASPASPQSIDNNNNRPLWCLVMCHVYNNTLFLCPMFSTQNKDQIFLIITYWAYLSATNNFCCCCCHSSLLSVCRRAFLHCFSCQGNQEHAIIRVYKVHVCMYTTLT